MRRNVKVALVAVAGAVAGALFARRRRAPEPAEPAADARAEELRRKLAEAREAAADADDFQAAGMAAETVVEEPAAEPGSEAAPEPGSEPVSASAPPEAAAEAPEPAAPGEPGEPAAEEAPPADEFEAMRRRVHEEGRAAAEQMRRSAEPPEPR